MESEVVKTQVWGPLEKDFGILGTKLDVSQIIFQFESAFCDFFFCNLLFLFCKLKFSWFDSGQLDLFWFEFFFHFFAISFRFRFVDLFLKIKPKVSYKYGSHFLITVFVCCYHTMFVTLRLFFFLVTGEPPRLGSSSPLEVNPEGASPGSA